MRKPKERGQVMVLLVVGIISLLGFTALAIDGARLFSERRNLQGVADTAAFTAAAYVGQFDPYTIYTNWYSGLRIEPHAEQAALAIIRENGYTDAIYNPFGGNDRLRITIDPVISGTEFTPYLVDIIIISEVEPIFAQLVYHDEILANADTEAIVWPKMNMAYGRALFATAPDGDRRIELTGTSTIDIQNSGIFSNSNDSQGIYISGSSSVTVDGAVTSVGGVHDSGSILTAGSVQVNAQPLSLAPVPTPDDCSALATSVESYDAISGITWHTAGRITTHTHTNSGEHHIYESGLYCISDDFHIAGGIVETEPEGVMFYFTPGDHEIYIHSAVVDLRAAQNGEANDSAGNVWDGMLIYMDEDNEGYIDLKPEPGSYFEGSIYAPSPSVNDPDPKCSLEGSGAVDVLELQFICYSIAITGNSGLSTNWNSTKVYESPITVNLEE